MTHSKPNSPHFMRSDLQRLQDSSPYDKPGLFLGYCRKIISAKQKGELSTEEAGYEIAGTMFIRELEEPLFDEITALAGSLELPYHISGIQPTEGWERLEQLIDEYVRLHIRSR